MKQFVIADIHKGLSLDYVREHLKYDPETGVVTRLKKRGNGPVKEDQITCIRSDGYMVINLKNTTFRLHRVIWFLVTGEWPKSRIDHENENKSDNRWNNLREATHQENMRNRGSKKNVSSPYRGVSWCKVKSKWTVRAKYDGVYRFLGYFDLELDAAKAYDDFVKVSFGAFANLNFKGDS